MIDLILGVHLLSAHTQQRDYQNNENLGIYAIYDGWTMGTYRNTLRRTSVYAGYTWSAGPFSLTAGGVTGYKLDPSTGFGFSKSNLSPMVAPSVKLGPARLWFIPSVGRTSSVLHFSLEKEFK